MAVVEVKEQLDRNGRTDERFARNYTRTYLARTDRGTDGPIVVQTSGLVPQVGQVYQTSSESDLVARVVEVDVDQLDNEPHLWNVRVRYSTEQNRSQQQQTTNPTGDPLLERPAVRCRSERRSEPATRQEGDQPGVFDKAIENSAGDKIDPAPLMDKFGLVVSITRNEGRLNLPQILEYQNVLNDAVFAGVDAGKWKVSITAAEELNTNNATYWRKQYELEYRDEGWDIQALDEGPFELVNGEKIRFVDKPTGAMPDIRNLDGAGAEAADSTTRTYLDFTVYKSKPFGVLNLPEDILGE